MRMLLVVAGERAGAELDQGACRGGSYTARWDLVAVAVGRMGSAGDSLVPCDRAWPTLGVE